MCSSRGTLALRSARAYRRLFSGGTAESLVGVGEEGGRGLGRHPGLVAEAVDEFGGGVGAQEVLARAFVAVRGIHRDHRVDQDRAVGPGTRAVDGVGGVGVSGVEVGRDGGGQVPAGREAEDPHALRVELPFVGAGPDGPDRPGGVLEHRWVLRLGPEPVFEDDPGHAQAVEPFGDRFAFVVGVAAVAAPRADHHRGPGGLLGRGEVDGQGRPEARGVLGHTGRAVGPERERLGGGPGLLRPADRGGRQDHPAGPAHPRLEGFHRSIPGEGQVGRFLSRAAMAPSHIAWIPKPVIRQVTMTKVISIRTT